MRFKAQGVIVRTVGECRIIFKDKESIVVQPNDGHNYYFHRWFAPKGSYGKYWGDFRRVMLRNKNLGTLLECIFYANKFGVQIHRTDREIDLKGRKIIERE